MTRINAIRKAEVTRDSVAWGKLNLKTITSKNVGVLFFAALLIVCSLAVGCNSDKPKPVNINNAMPAAPAPAPVSEIPAPAMQAAAKPVPKKVVRKRPANVTYADKTNGVSFEYPRRYALETGNAATDLVASSPLPMNFVQPGGVALAAVELPLTGFANTDFSSAFFNVSMNKNLSEQSCQEFSVTHEGSPETAKPVATSSTESTASAQPATQSETMVTTQNATSETSATSNKSPDTKPEASTTSTHSQPTKLMIGKMELQGTETVVGDGGKKTDAKYFHAFQNGACYEFALNLTTETSDKEDGTKQVNHKEVFNRLEKILATVKIAPVESTPEVTASAPAATSSPATETPAQ